VLNFVAPSFYSTTQTQTDGNDHVDFASLRGLGADQVLVLVNGKRRHTSALLHLGDNVGEGTAGVDLNSIPAAAIERVDILRDGAAAQYGSDAVAGVINIILKSNADGGAASALYGATSRSDGESTRADVNYGFPVGASGFVDLTAEYRHRTPTNRVGRWNGNVYYGNLFNFGEFGPNGEYASEEEYQADLAQIEARDFPLHEVQRIGDSRLTNATLFLNAAVPFSDSGEVYGFGGFTGRRGEATAFYRFPADQNLSDVSVYPDGYLPRIKSDITDGSLTAGVRGTRRGWTLDLSDSYGRNDFGFTVSNTLNPSLGSASPTSFDAGSLVYAQNTARLDVSRPFVRDGTPVANAAFGAEYRLERYQVEPGEEASYRNYATGPGDTTANGLRFDGGSQGFPGYQAEFAVDQDRTNVGLYADLEGTVARVLTLDGAARYEDYSDFGSNLSWKAAALLRPSRTVALRANVNTGFRAPSLHQVHTNKVSTIFADNQAVNTGLFNNESDVARALGVAPLDAETSVNYSAGVVLEPLPRLTVQADGYLVDIDDRIVLSGVLSRGDDPAIDAALSALPDVDAVQFFTNAVDTRTRGLDVSVDYPFVFRSSVLRLSWAGNLSRTEIRGPIRAPSGIGQAELLDKQERSWIESAKPEQKWTATARYGVGAFEVLARTTRFGAVESVNLFGPDERVPAAYITDVNLAYTLGDLTLSLGGNNVFDKLPPIQAYDNSYFGIFRYSRVVPYGTRGAFWYTSASFKL
jgi:iron complex outermembrane receptor protein